MACPYMVFTATLLIREHIVIAAYAFASVQSAGD